MVSADDRDVESRIVRHVTLKRKPMGSTTWGDAAPAYGRRVAPQDIDRGKSGRVRLSDRV